MFMVDIKELLKPNKFKLTLFLMLSIPCITLITLILGRNYIYSGYRYFSSPFILVDPLLFLISISIFLVAGLILSYLLGSFMDHYIQNQNLKIFIAFLSGMISIIIIYILYKLVTEPIICDPVHMPQNQTICDPVHEPGVGESYHTQVLKEIEVDSQAVQDSFQQCIQNLRP
jgi:hypothetical protein